MLSYIWIESWQRRYFYCRYTRYCHRHHRRQCYRWYRNHTDTHARMHTHIAGESSFFVSHISASYNSFIAEIFEIHTASLAHPARRWKRSNTEWKNERKSCRKIRQENNFWKAVDFFSMNSSFLCINFFFALPPCSSLSFSRSLFHKYHVVQPFFKYSISNCWLA